MKKILILLIFLLIFVNSVSASETVYGVLEEHDSRTYTIGGQTYEVYADYIGGMAGQETAILTADGKVTPNLGEGDEYDIYSFLKIQIIEVLENEAGEAAGGDKVRFKLIYTPPEPVITPIPITEVESTPKKGYCDGKKVNLSSDNTHCGSCYHICHLPEVCVQGNCTRCGNGVCASWETCELDNCCRGIEVNLNNDTNNCGTCGNKCDVREKCISGICSKYCGNGFCEANETCEIDNCCNGKKIHLSKDNENCGKCGIKCQSHEKCIDGDCQTYCGNGVCDPYETCENDSCCNGQKVFLNSDPRYCGKCDNKCESEERCENSVCVPFCSFGCFSNRNCYGLGRITVKDNKSIYCNGSAWIYQKELNEVCRFDYECQVGSCINGKCDSQTKSSESKTFTKRVEKEEIIPDKEPENVISRVVNWFRGLFG